MSSYMVYVYISLGKYRRMHACMWYGNGKYMYIYIYTEGKGNVWEWELEKERERVNKLSP